MPFQVSRLVSPLTCEGTAADASFCETHLFPRGGEEKRKRKTQTLGLQCSRTLRSSAFHLSNASWRGKEKGGEEGLRNGENSASERGYIIAPDLSLPKKKSEAPKEDGGGGMEEGRGSGGGEGSSMKQV